MAVPKPTMREAYGWAGEAEECHVLFCGVEDCHPSNRVDVVRDYWLFHLVTAGAGTVSYPSRGGRPQALGPGDGFFFSPGMQGVYRPDLLRPWSYRWLGFSGPGVPALLGRIGVDAGHPVVRLPAPGQAEALLAQILERLEARGPGDALRVAGLVRLLLAEVGTGSQGTVTNAEPRSPVDAARVFIEDHHHRGITVADVAAYVGLESSYLLKRFRAATGKSLRDYLIAVRLEQARLLLRRGETTVAQVAQSVGFENYSSFEKTFRRHLGITPTEYRSEPFFGA